MRIVRAAEDPVTFPSPPARCSPGRWRSTTPSPGPRCSASSGSYDVIHAHDWLVAHTAMTLREHLDVPLVSTIHATEAGRHQGWLPRR
ncbi:glycosyltransferase [Micromonospora sp. BRA006-A]|nr:glycosyltransferase [Micromonospora sp. BRA006-A]